MHLLAMPAIKPTIKPKKINGRAGLRRHLLLDKEAAPEIAPRIYPPALHSNTIRAIERLILTGEYISQAQLAARYKVTRGQVEYIVRRMRVRGEVE